jgi:RHS repeat-associated protein
VTGENISAYVYNGLGDRLSQTVNSVSTNYTLDLNTGLTQVLTDGTNTYLYGNGQIGEQQPAGFAYHLGDALGSVRQLTNELGVVTLMRNYEPFGSTLVSVGVADTVFQFTGEQRDASGLTFLRARYLSTSTGRFVTRDSWAGNANRPSSYNSWLYVYANPTNLVDPLGLWGFPLSPQAEKFLKENLWVSRALVAGAQAQYSKFGLSRICFLTPDDNQYLPTDTADDLLTDYICEYGPDHREFGADSPLTEQLAYSHSVYELREKFYRNGGYLDPGTAGFGVSEFLWAKIDIIFAGSEPTRFIFGINVPLNVTDFIGTYSYNVTLTSRDTIRYEITNRTSLESGTRVAPSSASLDISLEEYLSDPEAYKDRHIISILTAKDRDQTTGLEGGGNYFQTFTWEEPYNPLLACLRWYPPYPIGLPFINIMPAENEP